MKSPQATNDPPAGFLARMGKLLPMEEFNSFVAAFDRPSRIGLRVNTLKISVADFIRIAPFSLAPVGEWEPAGFLVTDDSRPGRHPYHDAGLYYMQEPSAMVAAALLAPEPSELVLDLAAAPGGKATHLLSRMTPAGPGEVVSALRRGLAAGGLLVANDVHAGRARLLADSLARWGAVNTLVTQDEPGRIAAAFGPVFDRVLIDAPCSGEGMFRRGEPVEWSRAIVAACARRQQAILTHAPELVKPGGQLLYSTCTFAPEENEAVVANLLIAEPDFRMLDPIRYAGFEHGRPEWASSAPPELAAQLSRAVRLWPQRFPGEGHFLALMERQGRVETSHAAPFRPQEPASEALRLWREFAAATLALEVPEERLHARNNRLFLLPKGAIDPGRARVVRHGLLLGEVRPGRFHPAHDLALALAVGDTTTLDFPAGDATLATYLSGVDLPSNGPDGWALVAVDGFGLGWGKRAGGRLKNHYPHYLRRR